MRIFKTFMGSVPALAGILLVILTAVNLIMLQDSFLNYTNHKYNVHQKLSVSENDLEKVTDSMVSYVKGQKDSPQIRVNIRGSETEFFNQKEIGHLKDVRELVKNVYIAMLMLFLIFLVGGAYFVIKKEWKIIRNSVFVAWGIVLLFAIVLGMIAARDIDVVVTGFHKMFLSDSKWILNPALDRSVRMFTVKMYSDVIKTLGAITGTIFLVTAGSALLLGKKKKKEGR